MYFDIDVSSFMWEHFLNRYARLPNYSCRTVENGLLLHKYLQITDSWLCTLNPRQTPEIIILPVNHLLSDLGQVIGCLYITWKNKNFQFDE